jgi:hypothetical protein
MDWGYGFGEYFSGQIALTNIRDIYSGFHCAYGKMKTQNSYGACFLFSNEYALI